MLQRLVADGALWLVNGTAFAVTPTLRESYAEGDDGELVEVALREAAHETNQDSQPCHGDLSAKHPND